MTNNISNPVTVNGTGPDSQNQVVLRETTLTVSLSLHKGGKAFYEAKINDWNDKPISREGIVFGIESFIKKMSWRAKYEVNCMLGPGLDKKLYIQSVTKNIQEKSEEYESWWSEEVKEYERCDIPVSFSFS